jgi:hypothetical protein
MVDLQSRQGGDGVQAVGNGVGRNPHPSDLEALAIATRNSTDANGTVARTYLSAQQQIVDLQQRPGCGSGPPARGICVAGWERTMGEFHLIGVMPAAS